MLKIDVSELLMPTAWVNGDLGSADGLDGQLQTVTGITWALRDEFTTDLAAGAVNGTAAEPGPGIRTVVDTGNLLLLSGGSASLTGKGGLGDPGIWYGVRTRTPGIMLIGSVTPGATDKEWEVGWDANQAGNITDCFHFNNNGTLSCNDGAATPVVASYTATNYKVIQILRASGNQYFVKGGAFTNWTLLYPGITSILATVYPGAQFRTAAGNVLIDFLRIPTLLWLPVPLLSTSGAMTWPTTNGLGHAETTGLGSGGSGLTLLDAGTWSVAGGYVLNTPGVGVEQNSNPELTTNTTGWTPGATTTIVRVDSTTDPGIGSGGADSQVLKVTAGASDGYATTTPSPITAAGQWFRLSARAYAVSGNTKVNAARYYLGASACLSRAQVTAEDSWQTIFCTDRTNGSTTPVVAATDSNGLFTATDVAYFDSISCKKLPISQLITNTQLATTDVLAEEVIHVRTAGTQVGMAVNLDRSFAAKAAATAAAGQRVISLKEVTGTLGSMYPTQDDTHVKATSKYSTSFWPYFATDPTKTITGVWSSNAWASSDSVTTNQRFHIDLGSATVINRIYYENGHTQGVNTNAGAKNFTIWGSNDASAFAELTYATDTNWTQIGGAYQFEQHSAADAADPKYITVTNSTAYRYYALKIADNWGNASYVALRRIELQAQGLTTSDTLTIAGTTYTIASVSGGSNVAYDDTAKTQTVTLGADLGAPVAADAKVGVDWAAWNGVLCYFDGAGNVKLDEVKGGVYTNRISAAVTFVADKRLITRKIGTSYYVFYNEALVGSTTAVDVAAQAGMYHGMFSTIAANTITSLLIYYVGSNGEYNANLNTFST